MMTTQTLDSPLTVNAADKQRLQENALRIVAQGDPACFFGVTLTGWKIYRALTSKIQTSIEISEKLPEPLSYRYIQQCLQALKAGGAPIKSNNQGYWLKK